MNNFNYKKNIVVTGASRGIGLATVKYLLSAGHRVFGLSRQNLHSELATFSADKPGELHWYTTDADLALVSQAITGVLSENEQLDGLIHNAGLLINKPFSKTTEDDWVMQFEVNVFMVFRWTRALESLMGPGSHVVHITSMGGVQGSSKFPGLSLYSAAKGAISIFTESLSTEWIDRGIAVNALALGAVQTEMLDEAFPGLEAPVQPTEMGGYVADFCLKGHRLFNGKILQVAMQNPA
tara:strand:+ start:557 stop:1270 length:714 start_codon:yes stop_codon:yes gene_type:complete